MKWNIKFLALPLLLLSLQLSNHKLEACGNESHGKYEAIIDSLGREIVVWSASDASIHISIGTPGQALNPVPISLSGQKCTGVQLGTNSQGDLVVLWLASDASKPTYSLYCNILPNGGNWKGVVALSNNVEGILKQTTDLIVTDSQDILVFWESITYFYSPSDPTQLTFSHDVNSIYGSVNGGFGLEIHVISL
jgi:hypothetical protein